MVYLYFFPGVLALTFAGMEYAVKGIKSKKLVEIVLLKFKYTWLSRLYHCQVYY